MNRKRLGNLPSISGVIYFYQLEKCNDKLLIERFYLGMEGNQETRTILALGASGEVLLPPLLKLSLNLDIKISFFLENQQLKRTT